MGDNKTHTLFKKIVVIFVKKVIFTCVAEVIARYDKELLSP